VGGGAGPGIFGREAADGGADGVALDVSHRQQAMRIVHGIGVKAILPEMAAASVQAVDVLRVNPMCSADRPGEGIGSSRDGDEMDVIVHQAVAEDGDAVAGALVGEELQVGAAVVIDEEDVLAIVAPLREMMWKTGDDDSG
jgi:hypothetical protein